MGNGMKILIDTHILLWALDDNSRLSQKARGLLLDPTNEIFFSVASLWELQIKHMLHPGSVAAPEVVNLFCSLGGYKIIGIGALEVFCLSTLKNVHKDPFDRLLLSQSKALGLKFLTSDEVFASYEEDCVIIA